MRPLTWDEYYEKFDTWSESTRAQYVSRLSNVGDHSQVADIANRLYNQGASEKLIRMACDAGVRFTVEDVVHENGYSLERGDRMEEMLLARQEIRSPQALSEWVKHFCARKWNSTFSKEMSRSCREIICSWCKDN